MSPVSRKVVIRFGLVSRKVLTHFSLALHAMPRMLGYERYAASAGRKVQGVGRRAQGVGRRLNGVPRDTRQGKIYFPIHVSRIL